MNTKLIQIILALMLFFGISFNAFAVEIEEENDYPKSILILGDSISTGYALENYDEKMDKTTSYGNLLAKKYQLTESYINLAIDGMNSSDLLQNLTQKKYDDNIKNTEYIIVSIGGNDVMSPLLTEIIRIIGLDENSEYSDIESINLNDVEIFKRLIEFITSKKLANLNSKIETNFNNNFTQITKYIYQTNPHANVIYQNVYNPFSGYDNGGLLETITDILITKINKIISANSSAIIDEKEVKLFKLVDIYSAFKSQGNKFTNILQYDIHPNSLGHEKIFELCDNLILSKNSVEAIKTTAKITTQATTTTTIATTQSEAAKAVISQAEIEDKQVLNFIPILIISALCLISVVFVFRRKARK